MLLALLSSIALLAVPLTGTQLPLPAFEISTDIPTPANPFIFLHLVSLRGLSDSFPLLPGMLRSAPLRSAPEADKR